MADVFLSYKRTERAQIERIASALRELGLNVWFDASMSAGDTFNDEIDREARAAGVVLVCWSPDARESEWVKAEAMIGFTQKKLAACYVDGPDGFDPPTPFNTRHAEDLRGWFAGPSNVHSGWKSVLRTVGKLCGRPDIESYGALDTQATASDLRAWIDTHEQSPLFVTVDELLHQRDAEDAERGRIENEVRERRAQAEKERRAKEAIERAAREEEERRRPPPRRAGIAPEIEADTTGAFPPGFATLLLTETFERFAYYGMRAIVVLYCVQHLALAEQQVFTLYGVFTGLVYLLPLFGAIIADRLIGARRSIAIGATLLALGYALLSASALSAPTGNALTLTFGSLALIIVGSGLVKPSVFASLGALYGANDPRRDGGFTIVYTGINVGAFAAAVACGYVGQTYGWALGFALASLGMVLGLIVFLTGQNSLKRVLEATEPAPSFSGQAVTWGLSAAAAAGVAFFLMNASLAEQLMPIACLAAAASALLYVFATSTGDERPRLLLAFVLIAFVTVFWTLFEVSGSALYRFAESNVDFSALPVLNGSNHTMAAAVMTIVTAVPLAFFWIALSRAGADLPVGIKFVLGLVLVGASFLVAVFAAQFANAEARVPVSWFMTLLFLQTLGELFIAPIGLSAMTKLAPMRIAGVMISVWLMSSWFAQPVSSQVVAWITPAETVGGQVTDPAQSLNNSVGTFYQLGLIGLAVGGVLLLAWPFLSRLARNKITAPS